MVTILECAKLADAAYGRSFPAGFHKIPFRSTLASGGKGFAGMLFERKPVGFVTFRGSQETTDWIHADTDIALDILPGQLGEAFSFFADARRELKSRGCEQIFIVGHSLGGALAALVGARITTFPTVAVTFNAPGCKGFERAGRFVDDNDRLLADTIDTARAALGDERLNPLARVGVAAGGILAATFQASQLAARRAMELSVVQSYARIAVPSSNERNVHNVVSVSRIGAQEVVSNYKTGYIGLEPDRVPVKVLDPMQAHMIGPLVDALQPPSPTGARRLSFRGVPTG